MAETALDQVPTNSITSPEHLQRPAADLAKGFQFSA
jgi:hypothetical protein